MLMATSALLLSAAGGCGEHSRAAPTFARLAGQARGGFITEVVVKQGNVLECNHDSSRMLRVFGKLMGPCDLR